MVRYPGWTVRTVVRALIAADGHLGAETAMIPGALHRSVTRTGLVHPPRKGHVMGTFLSSRAELLKAWLALTIG